MTCKPMPAYVLRFGIAVSIVLSSLNLSGCSNTVPGRNRDRPQGVTLTAVDARAYHQFPDSFEQIAAARLPDDDSGLIGRNRTWGRLYSPRFQLGAGTALRIAIAANRPTEGARAFRAIEVATENIQPNGYVSSAVPAEISNGREPSSSDIASGAAFFLGDACLGIVALELAETPNEIVAEVRRDMVRDDLVLAARWLLTQQSILLQADEQAPNRLLFNALSFQACVALVSDEVLRIEMEEAAQMFVEGAIALYSAEGYFIEGGGYDTSYQGVAIRVGEDILLSGYVDPDGKLQDTLTGAAFWLSERINSDGEINSVGNRRTCEGGEVFLGKKKSVAVTDVLLGLAYASVRTEQPSLQASAERVEQWAQANRGVDPCFP